MNTLSAHTGVQLEAALAKALSTDTADDRQVMHELSAVNDGIERFRVSLADQATKLADTAGGRKIFDEVMTTLVPAIRAAQDVAIEGIANAGKGPRPVWWWYISFVAPEKLAFITIRSILHIRMQANGLGRKATAICLDIGLAVKQQIEFEKWLADSKRTAEETGGRDLAAQLVRRSKNFNQRQWGNWTRKIEAIETLDWRRDVKIHIGAKLLELVIENSGGFFEMRYVQLKGKTERQVFLSAACQAMVEDVHSRLEVMSPPLRPMLVPATEWSWCADNKRYVGGYKMIDVELIRGGLHRHTAALEQPLSETTLRACSLLGRVPFRVDDDCLDVAQEVYDEGLDIIDYLPKPDPVALPSKTDEEWDAMSKIEKAEWKYQLSQVHGKNARDVSKRESAIRKFNIANTHRGMDVYHPVKMDTRTRFYYITQDWNPQGDGLARGTMRFGRGVALGDRGLYWLAVRLCNTFGYDKVTFDEMQVWVREHHDMILDSANDPFNGWRFWADADSPLEFLQSAIEWRDATSYDAPERFVSSLPVHQDGSNNGLQLMSLLGRDVMGARLTNCSADPARYDIYGETAKIVQQLIVEDIANGHRIEEAQQWVGHVDRSVCKRACMTTSYGVTPRGIQDQLLNDGHVDKLDGGDRMKNAAYMRDKLIEALEKTVVASRPIMDYFQSVASSLAEFDKPLQWITPAGSVVQQSYWNIAKSDVKTVMGSYYLWDENPLGGLNVRKQHLSSSPNVIHSLDASLMQKLVVKLHDVGVEDICCIHDSFAVHAANVDIMRDLIRETAAEMFAGDWITDEFHPYVQTYAGKVELPEPPTQGDFDVNEVLNAEYFFA